MRQKVEQQLAELVGKPLWDSGRAADLQWFQFGERRQVARPDGGMKEVGELALHVQCAWRIASSEGVLVASRDRYHPADAVNVDIEDFRWDVQGANRCDERMSALFESAGVLRVESFEADDQGGFQLSFPGGVKLEVFPDDSLANEHWRLFRPSESSPHFVVSGSGAETT